MPASSRKHRVSPDPAISSSPASRMIPRRWRRCVASASSSPARLKAFGGTANPDSAFTRFDQFIGRLPAGVQFFSLLQANPALLELIAEIMGSAPRLAEQLARQPILLDGVLSAD